MDLETTSNGRLLVNQPHELKTPCPVSSFVPKNRLREMVDPPPKPSLKLMAQRGEWKWMFPCPVVWS